VIDPFVSQPWNRMKHGIRSWVAMTDGFKSKEVQDSTDAEQSEKGLNTLAHHIWKDVPF